MTQKVSNMIIPTSRISGKPKDEVFRSWMAANQYYDAYEDDIALVQFYTLTPQLCSSSSDRRG